MNREYNVALLPGDGTGPEVLAEGIKVVQAACQKFGFTMKFTKYDLGGERYIKTGEVLPDSVVNELTTARCHLSWSNWSS